MQRFWQEDSRPRVALLLALVVLAAGAILALGMNMVDVFEGVNYHLTERPLDVHHDY